MELDGSSPRSLPTPPAPKPPSAHPLWPFASKGPVPYITQTEFAALLDRAHAVTRTIMVPADADGWATFCLTPAAHALPNCVAVHVSSDAPGRLERNGCLITCVDTPTARELLLPAGPLLTPHSPPTWRLQAGEGYTDVRIQLTELPPLAALPPRFHLEWAFMPTPGAPTALRKSLAVANGACSMTFAHETTATADVFFDLLLECADPRFRFEATAERAVCADV